MTPDFNREVYCILGLPFDAVDLAEAEQKVRRAIAERTPCLLSTPNLNFAIACRSDPAFRNSVINSDLVIVDGMPLVWIARLLGLPIRERVAGSTLFERLRRGNGPKIAIYFFGGSDGVAAAASERLNGENGSMRCVGYHSPADH